MRLSEYYTILDGLQANAPAGDAAAASLMSDALRDALAATGVLHSIELGGTEDGSRLVIGMCGFLPGTPAAEVAELLGALWEEQVSYPFWSARSTLVEDGHVELMGATRVSPTGHYLTVHLIAQEAEAPASAAAPAAQPAVQPAVPTQRTSPSTGRRPGRRGLGRIFARSAQRPVEDRGSRLSGV
jgi:hypothetical protein